MKLIRVGNTFINLDLVQHFHWDSQMEQLHLKMVNGDYTVSERKLAVKVWQYLSKITPEDAQFH